MATSKCKYCFAPVLWVQKPSGSWHPPFNAPQELEDLDYEVAWSPTTGDWTASPVDTEVTAKLSHHDCPLRTAQLQAEREANQALMDAAEPMDRLETEPDPTNQLFSRPGRRGQPPRLALPVRTIYRNPPPDSQLKVARRLKQRCPTCGVMPFEWCVYKNNPDERTENLHTSRKDLG